VAKEVSFIGGSQNCCVCFIDLVDSTRITTIEITQSEKIKRVTKQEVLAFFYKVRNDPSLPTFEIIKA
jgi:hypothetical protein